MPFHGYSGQAPARRPQSANFSQASTRHGIIMFDQHGREWSASVENRSGMPTGRIARGFTAPFEPDQKYLLVNPENTNELYIDYPTMYAERRSRLQEYHAGASAFAADKGWEQPEFGKYSSKLMNAYEFPPRAIELVVAAAQGNPFILGLSAVEDPRLVPFLEHYTTALEDAFEDYDFGADSYIAATDGASEGADIRGRGMQGRPVDFAALRARSFESEDALAGAAGVAIEADPFDELGVQGDDDVNALVDDDSDDPEALGGRVVRPQNMDRAERQAPRPVTQTTRRKHRRTQPTLADGAKPGIADSD